VRLDERCDTTSVARDGSFVGVDVGHPLRALRISAAQGLLGQFAEIPAPGRSATTCLHIDSPEQIVGEGHHHFRHIGSTPGVARCVDVTVDRTPAASRTVPPSS